MVLENDRGIIFVYVPFIRFRMSPTIAGKNELSNAFLLALE